MTNADSINLKITVDANQAQQSTTNYKAKLKELKDQMAELLVETNGLADATDEQRAKYESLAKEAGSLTDALGDVSARIRANADDYQMFNAALEGLKGGAAVAQGLVGTLDLLGLSNSGVEQVVKTLMSLQGIMNSINAVQQVFNKDSKVRIALQKLLSTEVKKTAVAEGQATVAAGALAAGEGVATAASFTLAGACKAVGVAIKSIPVIGWILAAVAALATLISLISKANKESDNGNKVSEETVKLKTKLVEENQKRISALRDIEKEAERIKEHYKEIAGYIKEGNVNLLKYTDSVTEAAAALGVSKEFVEENRESIDGWLESSAELVEYQKLLAENEKYYNEQLNERNALVEDVTTIYNSSWEVGLALIDKAKEKYHLTDEEVTKISRTLNDVKNLNGDQEQAIKNINTHLSTTLTQYDQEISKIQKVIEPQKEKVKNEKEFLDAIKQEGFEYDEQKKREEERKKRAEKWRTDRKAAQTEYVKQVEDMAIADAEYDEDYDRLLEARKAKRNREYDEDKKKYDEQLKQKLISQEQYDTLVLASTEKLNNDIAKLEADNQKRIDDENERIAKENEEKETKRIINKYEILGKEEELAKARGRVAGLEEGTPEYFDALIEVAEAQRELELEQLEQDKEAKLLSEEDYQIRKKEIIDRYRTENLQAQRDDAQKEIEIKELTYQAIGEIASGLHSTLGSLQEAELADENLSEKEKLKIQKKYAISSLLINIAESGVALATSIPKTLEAYADIPVAGPIIAAVQIAATTAAIIAQIAKIRQLQQQINKAAKGAYIVGPSHSQGGVTMELEGGEMVLNKNVAKVPQFRAIASAMNVATGGVALGGGGVASQQSFGVTKEDVQSIVAETVAGIAAIPVVVSAQTITETQRRVNVTQTRSQI